MPLPFQLANNGEQGQTIAVIGYRNTGKSNFLGVLIRSLQHRYSREVGLSIHALDSFDVNQLQACSSDDLYQRRYGRYLDNDKAVAGTPTLHTNPDIRIPMIYRLNMKHFTWFQRLLQPFSHHRPLDLILFDAAGEDLDSTETQQLYSRYIAHASGIILLVDPLAYPSIRRDVRSDILQDSYSNEFDTFKVVMDSMSRYNKMYKANRRIRTPLAVVFSKFDELRPDGEPLEGLDPSVFNDHVHDHCFAKDLVDDTSEKIYRFLEQRGIGSVISSLDEYQNYRLFGMSALGNAPAEDHSLSCISPINIADPLLWILHELGYLPAKEEIAK